MGNVLFERALGEADDGCLSEEGALSLASAEGEDRRRVMGLADEKRNESVGREASWVFNRNVNFTDVCVKDCSFCSFRRKEGYLLSPAEVVGLGRESRERGATEVTVQGGIHPGLDFGYYREITEGLSATGLHVHAFSPQEVHSISTKGAVSTLRALKSSGLGSMPGTAAEILADEVRREICPSKIETARWVEIVKSAHGLGIPTSATMMYGHVESWSHRVRHMSVLQEIQRETGGFTEFVPLPFVPGRSELRRRTDGGRDDLLVVALARLFLGEEVRNVQASWVKLGREGAVAALRCGANDLGGTLIEEKISRRAGAMEGQSRSPSELEEMIESAGLEPSQRDTLYRAV
ncbi:MAG: FO synthase subunit 2 [Methanonatronarchaeales archaeon]|nr:FO synthase subunit 2 [Methanonatronarchaeales archaeon]